MGTADLGEPKAKMLASHLQAPGLQVEHFGMTSEQYARQTRRAPAVVLNRVWTTFRATPGSAHALAGHCRRRRRSGDFTCQVSRHPWPDDSGVPEVCLFREPASAPVGKYRCRRRDCRRTALFRPDDLLSASDVERAPRDKEEFLRARSAKPICFVIQEGVALNSRRKSTRRASSPPSRYRLLHACIVIAEMVAHLMKWPSAPGTAPLPV